MLQLIIILCISVIHIIILFTITPFIDHIFTPLNDKESNTEILIEIITQLLTLSVIWYLLNKYVLYNINKYFKLNNVKLVSTILDIIYAVVLIGLQSNLINKLEYITYKHPFRLFQLFND
tara:strand:- start:55 stop:414 length:360 start_codon:yes stop_codon:yes gene_type:complete